MEYTAKKSFRYRSRMVVPGETVELPRAFALVLMSRGRVAPGRVASAKKPAEKKQDNHAEIMKGLRAEYRKKFGKGPGPTWDASTIREKLDEA